MQTFKWPIVAGCSLFSFIFLIMFKDSQLLATVSVVTLGAIMLYASWSWEHFVVYVSLFVVAIGMEIISVSVGLWSYGNPAIFGVPLWIPFVWSNSALFVIELKEVYDERFAR